ncbi:MAG: glycosyltransferase [Candidatus Marinimicrobia bacterium]|nr:glycosyltransferase [Candidatus Neomarinimicrobiota bacterium]
MNIFFSIPDSKTQSVFDVRNTVNSILNQSAKPNQIFAIGDAFDGADSSIQFLSIKDTNTTTVMNQAIIQSDDPFILLIDNLNSPVYLNSSAIDICELTMKRNPNASMIYSDYDLDSDGKIQEIHLLHHHEGRVRDNQDYGKVFCIRKSAIQQCGGFDESLKYNTLYDLRLKLSVHGELIRIANRYSGSLYTVTAKKEAANVFDYLMESKESQVEAEKICTDHLRRIGAYLPPNEYYQHRPEPQHDPPLKATVIIPVNERPEFIGTALESCFQQTVREIEIIVVVNGGENDTTIPEVKRFMSGGDKFDENSPEVRLIVLDINNIGFCLNSGVNAAKGEFYVQLDSDDRLKPNAVEKLLQVFNSDLKIGMVIGSYDVWEQQKDETLERKEEIPTVTHNEWTDDNGRNNLLRIGGAGAPRCMAIQVIKDVGYFGMNDDPYSRNYAEDYELVMRISEKYKIGRIYDAIYDVIRHPGGTDHSIDEVTVNRNDDAKDHMRLVAIQRRKALNQT